MSTEDEELLSGPHSLGAERTIDLETLLAVSHIVGHLGVVVNRMQPELIDSLARVLQGGVFHHAEAEFRLDPATATMEEKRAELERCLHALRQQLKKINHQES